MRTPGASTSRAGRFGPQRIGDEIVRTFLPAPLPIVGDSVDHLVALGIVRETSGRQRGRTFVYDAYPRLLDEGTEQLPPGA